jgi:hypothetical protein
VTTQSDEILKEGFVEYASRVQDSSAMAEFAIHLTGLGAELQRVVRPDDRCALAFGSVIIRPDARVGCLIAVLEDRVLAVWNKGRFKKSPQTVAIPRSSISKASAISASSLGPGVRVFRIEADGEDLVFALPRDNWREAESAVLAALGLGEEQAELGAGEPKSAEIAAWHPDPWRVARLRWWDGTEWTGHTAD